MAGFVPFGLQYELIQECVLKDDDVALLPLVSEVTDEDLLSYALYCAAEHGRPHCLALLISMGANVNFWNSSVDETVLGAACSQGHLEVARQLLHSGAEINKAAGGNLHVPLHTCARNGQPDCAELLLEQQADVNRRDCFHNTALMIACREGHAAVVRCLLQYGALHTYKNVANNTAFSLATDNGHATCVRELLCAYPELANTRTREGIYPLTSAIRHQRGDLVKAFVDSGCDVNCPESALLTPLHLAIEIGDEELVGTLARGGAHVSRPLLLPMRPTPLMIAVAKGNASLVRCLVAAGADVDTVDALHRSALYLATKFGYLQCMDALLQGGADPDRYCSPLLDPSDADFFLPSATPLHSALLYDRDDEAVLLLQAGADPDRACLLAAEQGGLLWQTPMEVACLRGQRWAVKLLLRAGSQKLDVAQTYCDLDAELIALLEQAHYNNRNPAPLKAQCRHHIRDHLGQSVFEKIEALPLPQSLLLYLRGDYLAQAPQSTAHYDKG